MKLSPLPKERVTDFSVAQLRCGLNECADTTASRADHADGPHAFPGLEARYGTDDPPPDVPILRIQRRGGVLQDFHPLLTSVASDQGEPDALRTTAEALHFGDGRK